MKTSLRLALSAAAALAAANAAAVSVVVQVLDGAGKPLADVVVSADPQAGAAVPKHLRPAEIAQKGLKFLPAVSVIQTGSRIAFPNNDKVKHHIYSFSPAKKFDQKLYSGVAASPQVFDKAGLVVLGCNIHDRMVAYIKVVDTPWFAKTDSAGVARIEAPAGQYAVSAWHPNMSGAPVAQALTAGDAPVALSIRLAMKPPVAEPGTGVEF